MSDPTEEVSKLLFETCVMEDVNDEQLSDAIKSMNEKQGKRQSVRTTAEKLKALTGVSGRTLSMMPHKSANVNSKASRRASFRHQVEGKTSLYDRDIKMMESLTKNMIAFQTDLLKPFKSTFAPEDMRCLALVAHNHMKPSMMDFIETHSEILKKFKITGTNTTMSMCRTVYGDDSSVFYGPTCTSGPLGGDAQLCALMCLENVGAVIFFMDPLSAHPHQADIDSLIRMCNVHNVVLCPNPTTACAMMYLLRQALINGKREMIPSFFETLESPAVDSYKNSQDIALKTVIDNKKSFIQ